MGADGVELDVHASADGTLVVHHDATIDARQIASVAYSELASYRLANGEAVPTLPEALAAIGLDLDVFIEVKTLASRHDEHLFEIVDQDETPNRCHIHSFDHRIVKRLRDKRPALSFGVLSASYQINPLTPLLDTGARTLWQTDSLVDRDLIASAHRMNYLVYIWTVDDPERMRYLRDIGVDAVCTNRPDVALEVLR